MATLAMSAVTSQVNKGDNFINNAASAVGSKIGLEDYFKDDVSKKDKLVGRTANLTIQTSTYGEVIPIVFGTVRIAGNIIWATDIKEVVNVETSSSRVGGKGSPKVTQNQVYYHYFATLAIGICEGEIDELTKIWANETCIKLSEINYTLYKGTSDQNPDPTIQSYDGIEDTPAYRDLAYIVIEDFPLADYGNRIPNFTFEITRNVVQENSQRLESLIESVIMIPGTGEFVYDTLTHYKNTGWVSNGSYITDNQKEKINENNVSGKADAIVSLDQMQQTLPNLKWVAPVVCWFANDTNIENISITPRVEFNVNVSNNPTLTTPSEWEVSKWNRSTAQVASEDENGNIRYGGTVSDESIIRYLQELKSRNYNVLFYPMVFVDVENKPWRGRITGNLYEVSNFFTKENGYNEFILHYANLVKD